MPIGRSFIHAAIILGVISGIAWAHHPSGSAGLGQAGPIRTASASTLQEGKWFLALQAEFIDLNEYSDARLLEFSASGKDAHTAVSVFHAIAGIGYGITDDLTISLRIPYERISNIREAHSDEPGEIHVHGNAKGLGDLTLMGQYRFIRTDNGLETAAMIGLKMPTGKTNDRDIHGEVFEAEFQPGTGAWSPIVGVAVTKRSGAVSLDGSLQYTAVTRGTQRTNLGDIVGYNAAISYRPVSGETAVDVILELNGEWKEKQEIRGKKDRNSGGNTIFLSPGARVVFGKKVSSFLSVGIPLLQDLNGIQDDAKYKALFGLSFGL